MYEFNTTFTVSSFRPRTETRAIFCETTVGDAELISFPRATRYRFWELLFAQLVFTKSIVACGHSVALPGCTPGT